MSKVVFQGIGYWLETDFWQEALAAGVDPFRAELRNGVFVSMHLTRDEFAARTGMRVAGWSHSVDKSVSVFLESLSPANRLKVLRQFQASIQKGLEVVAGQFTARTGAQGKVRLPAEVGFAVAIRIEAKNGSPQLHAHIAVDERVRVVGRTESYATHTRELYRYRKVFEAAVTQEFAHRLRNEFGVRVRKTERGLHLPEVPRALCKSSSGRSGQIDDYIAKHQLVNTPVTRRYAALATRRENPDRQVGRVAFRADLLKSGFRGESICRRVSRIPSDGDDSKLREAVLRRVGLEARRLAGSAWEFSRNDLLARVLKNAPARYSVAQLERAVKAVLESSNRIGLRESRSRHDQPLYSSGNPPKQWQRVRDQIEFLFAERGQAKDGNQGDQRNNSQTDSGGTRGQSKSTDGAKAGAGGKADTRSEESTTSKATERILRSYRVIGAVGQIGLRVAAQAIELYRIWSKPVWRVQGYGNKRTAGSVAAMVRDLKKLPILESHKVALSAMVKLNGSLDQKLRYGEAVFRRCRRPKFRIPRNALIVVRDVASADPKDLRFLMKKAERANAKILLVERDYSRSALVNHARSMRPGECRRIRTPRQTP